MWRGKIEIIIVKQWKRNRTAWNEREAMDLRMEDSKSLSYKGLRINNGSGLRLEHRE